MKELKKIAILGSGVMGAQLALLCAESGLTVKVRDIDQKYLDIGLKIIEDHLNKRIKKKRLTEQEKGNLLSKIQFLLDPKEAVNDADYIIEAVTEELKIKHAVFKEVYQYAPKHTIFGTNTSALIVNDIAADFPEPERMIGVHFFNPPGTMKLLEIIYGDKTSEETKKATDALSKLLGRVPVYCVKDSPGFVAVRLLSIMINESAWAVELEGANFIDVDASMKFRLGLPIGMFELLDTLGGGTIELQHKVGSYIQSKLGDSYRNCPSIEDKFKAGELGQVSGKGFFDWSNGKTNEIPFKAAKNFDPIRILAPLVNDAAILVESGVMTREDLDTSMTVGLGFPRGLLRMADSVGLDSIVAENNRLFDLYGEDRYKCSPMLENLVAEGKLGRKTGRGIYSYGPGEYELIALDFDNKSAVATLTINRPNRANSLNFDCYAEINDALDAFEASDEVKCLVITGAGKNFSAGADIAMFGSGNPKEMVDNYPPVQNLLNRLETMGKPVIAAINGACLGGGLELAISCDLRIARKGAILGLAEANLGLFPGAGGTQRITRLIGWARAKEMVMLANNIPAEQAFDWGLVNMVAEPDQFKAVVGKIAQSLVDKAGMAQGVAKRVMYYGAQADQQTAIFLEGSSFPSVILSDEASEGITAFMYRRKPKFGA